MGISYCVRGIRNYTYHEHRTAAPPTQLTLIYLKKWYVKEWYIKTYVFDCWRSKVLSNRTNVLLVTKTIIQAVLQSACVFVTWNSKHHVVMPHDSLVIVWQSQIIFKVFVLQSHDIPDIICYSQMIFLTLYVTATWYSFHYMLQSHDIPDIICYSHMIFLPLYVTATWYYWRCMLKPHDIPDIICYSHMILLTLYVKATWYSWHYMLQS